MTDQEHKDWIEVAEMLRFNYEPLVNRLAEMLEWTAFKGKAEDWAQATIHGLACLEANGCVQRALARDRDGEYWWDISTKEVIDSDSGYADTHSAALIAMLNAHRGMV